MYIYTYILYSDPRHTECSNLTEARKQCALPVITKWLCGNSSTWAHDVRFMCPSA